MHPKSKKGLALLSYILITTLTVACSNSPKYSTDERPKVEELALPEGAIPILYQNHLYLNARIDSIEGKFLFDTGAHTLYIDSTFLYSNDLEYTGNAIGIMGGVGNRQQRVPLITDEVSLQFGTHRFSTRQVPIVNLKPLLGDLIDGILGKEYFQNSVLEVNYHKGYIRMHSSADSLDLGGYTKLKLKQIGSHYALPVSATIDEQIRIEGDALLDLGSAGTLSISSTIAKRYDLEKHIQKKLRYQTHYGGIGLEANSYDFIAQQLELDNLSLKQLPMDFSSDNSGALASSDYIGILGNEVLDRFDLVIDFDQLALYLKPNDRYQRPFDAIRCSFSYVDRAQTLGCWVVSGLYPEEAAAKAGLQIDDQIVRINGKSVEQFDYKEQVALFDNSDQVDLDIRRGTKQLSLRIELGDMLPTEH